MVFSDMQFKGREQEKKHLDYKKYLDQKARNLCTWSLYRLQIGQIKRNRLSEGSVETSYSGQSLRPSCYVVFGR